MGTQLDTWSYLERALRSWTTYRLFKNVNRDTTQSSVWGETTARDAEEKELQERGLGFSNSGIVYRQMSGWVEEAPLTEVRVLYAKLVMSVEKNEEKKGECALAQRAATLSTQV